MFLKLKFHPFYIVIIGVWVPYFNKKNRLHFHFRSFSFLPQLTWSYPFEKNQFLDIFWQLNWGFNLYEMGGNEFKKPLLNKVFYKNCPGCNVDQYKELQTGYPIKEVLCIWFLVLSTGKQQSCLTVYLTNF